MKCTFCKAPLRGMTDSRRVDVNGTRSVSCHDLDACGVRVFANERSARGLEPKHYAEDHGPNGDATTPGFFKAPAGAKPIPPAIKRLMDEVKDEGAKVGMYDRGHNRHNRS